MAKKTIENKTSKVYPQAGGNERVKSCPEAIADNTIGIDNRERSIVRSNYGKDNGENRCGDCIFFDISNRMKKCMDTETDNNGYCWDQEFVCNRENVCDMFEEGGPITSNEESYSQDETYSEFEENKEAVEEIQTAQQMPIAGQEQQQQMPQMMAPQGPPQGMAPPQQAPPQEQMQPTYAYGGSLRKAQFQNLDRYGDFTSGKSIDELIAEGFTPEEAEEMRASGAHTGEQPTAGPPAPPAGELDLIRMRLQEEKRLAGLDNNTDIYDAANPKEAGASIKDKFKLWNLKRKLNKANRRYNNRDENFAMYNAPVEQGMPGKIANWFKSVHRDFTQNWDNDNQKANYQQFKLTNPHDETRFFDPSNPDELKTYETINMEGYNKYSENRATLFPELYSNSTMDINGEITYTDGKLLGDMVETEYMPDAVHIVHTDDNKGIKGSYIFDGVDDNGKKKFKFISFDAENPMSITHEPNSQQNANQQMEDKTKCLEAGGTWEDGVCTYPEEKTVNPNNQAKANKKAEGLDLDNIEYDDDLQLGGAPTYSYMQQGGSLTKFQSKNEWTDEQLQIWLKLQNDMLATGAAGSNTSDGVTYDPSKIDLTDKATYPGTWGSVADGTYNTLYDWLPDTSTKEGRSAAYNLHRTAAEKFPDQAGMPGVYWGSGDDGIAQPYLNESVSEKSLRTGDFQDYNAALQFLNDNPGIDPSLITIGGNPMQTISNYMNEEGSPAFSAWGDGVDEHRLANNSRSATDISNTTYDANYSTTVNNLYEEWKLEQAKADVEGKGVDNQKSFERWVTEGGKMDDYVPDYQMITADNYKDAIMNSGNPYFQGEMGGYGGPSIGTNTGNQQITLNGEQVDNPMFVDHGPDLGEMGTLMGYIPAAVAGAGALRAGFGALNYLGGLSVPGTSGALNFGNLANAHFVGNAVTNTLPQAYTDYQNEDYGSMGLNLGIGALEMSGVGNMGMKILPKNFSSLSKLNPSFPALNTKGTNMMDDIYRANTKQMPTFNVNPFSSRPSQVSQIKDFLSKDFSKLNLNPNFQPNLIRKYGGSLYKAQNGAEDVAAMYQVNPEQFDYDANMPKEGAISAYGDVWQSGAWVDATSDQHGFTTPDSDQFGAVSSAFSDETGVINRSANYDPSKPQPFSAGIINREMKSAAADTYNVRRGDINKDTWTPKSGSINKSYGDIWSDDGSWSDKENVTPSWDQTDDFAFEGDNNTLSRGQLRDVRKDNRRQNKAEKKGFSSWDEMQTAKDEKRKERKQRRKDRSQRWGDTLGVKARNIGNYVLDSDISQAWQKGSKALVKGAGIVSDFLEADAANYEQEKLLTSRTADQMYGVTSADALSRGEHDENSGIFQTADKVIARQDGYGKYGTELPRAQYGYTGSGQTNPRMGLKYNSGENPLSLFVGADRMNCWGGSCKDDGGGKFKRGFYSEFSPYKKTTIPQTITPDGEITDGEAYEQWTASGDLGGRLRFDQDFYSLPIGGPSGIMLEGSGGAKFGEDGLNPYYGGRVGMQFKAPRGLKLPKFNYASKDRADFMPQSQLDLYADWKNNEGLKFGADARWGILNAGVTYNPSTSDWEYSGGIGAWFKSGGEKKEKTMNIDSDMYYELIAAGADIEII